MAQKHLLAWLLLALLIDLAAPRVTARAGERSHIVVFLSDDHTRSDSSLYGSMDMPTPHMERIAAQGIAFDEAYVVSPSCAPSRAALLTGLMPARNGAERNHARPRADIKKLPAYLQELGYEVVSFGKVGHYNQTPEYGFDSAKHFGYHDDAAVGEAIEWLEARQSDKPLCLFVGTNWPHVPWPKESDFDPPRITVPSTHVDTPETRAARARYYQAVRKMDDELGAVFDAAYRKLGPNTLFLHSSDHGAQWPFGKWTLYDDGLRTPMIAVWPGQIEARQRTNAMVSWVDILPTLVEAAGGATPQDLDGRSFLPLLTGATTEHREEVFAAHSGDGNFNVYPSRALRDQRYKYILNLYPQFTFESHVSKVINDSPYWPSWVAKAAHDDEAAQKVRRYQRRPAEELYDVQEDPHELNNLANSPAHRERLEAMRSKVEAWMDQQGDQRRVYGLPKLLREESRRPNVVTVFIDDMGWSDLSCFGGQAVQTTQIDRLASEGLRFTNFYVNSPICSPSRTALTTGNYPARHRITSYLDNRAMNRKRGIANWLDSQAVTLPRMFAEAGYRVGHFGKWHMGGQRDVGDAPLISQYGFHESLTNFEGLGPRVLPLCYAAEGQPPRRYDLGSAKLGHGPIEWEDRSLITKRFVDEAIKFIDASTDANQPFFVNVWPDDVHSPFYPPMARRDDDSKRGLYHGVLKTMDEQLGPLFNRIRSDPQLRGNTLILLASDNGPERGAGSCQPLRGGKTYLYEGGIRSPLIVWGPGIVDASAVGGTNDATIASSVDLVASLITLANLSPPGDYQCDGEDLSAALVGLTQAQRAGPLFWRRPPDRPGTKELPNPDLAIRSGQWKLLTSVDGSGTQLYNLRNDICEMRNLADRRPQIADRLKQQLLTWNRGLPQDGIELPSAPLEVH